MRYPQRPRQNNLFDRPDEHRPVDALPTANRVEAILLWGKLLYEIVQVETPMMKREQGDEQDHR